MFFLLLLLLIGFQHKIVQNSVKPNNKYIRWRKPTSAGKIISFIILVNQRERERESKGEG